MQRTQSGDTEKGLMNALAEVERRGAGKVSQTDLELNTDEQRGKEIILILGTRAGQSCELQKTIVL